MFKNLLIKSAQLLLQSKQTKMSSQPHICQCLHHLSILGSDSALIIYNNRQKTGRQFVEQVLSLACRLAELGVRPGDVVAISALNSDWYLEWLLAVAFIGGIAAPLNYRWSLEEYTYALAAVRPVMLVYDETLRLNDFRLADIPSIRWHAFIGSHPEECKTGAMNTNMTALMEIVEIEELTSSSYKWAPDGAAIICFTSGTSGKPKGVVLSHNALIIQSMAKLDIVGYNQDDVYLHTASLCHIGGISSALAMLMTEARHVITPKFEAEEALRCIEDYQVTCFITVPAMLSDLISTISGKETCGARKSVKKILNGGGSLQGYHVKEALKYFPNAKLQSAYGMTEGCSSLAFLTLHDPADGTPNGVNSNIHSPLTGACVGKPAAHIELKICAEDNSSRIGKILTRGPHLMLRYCDSTSPRITNFQRSRSWLDTGDIGYLDEQGNLWLIGRTSGRIKSGGENVYPEEVEVVVSQHPGVSSVVVIGIPDGRLGEMVVACVKLRQNWLWNNVTSQSNEAPELVVSENQLRHFCKNKKLTGFKIPKHFICWKRSFPVTATGKVIREQVRRDIVSSYQVSAHSRL